MKKEFGVYPVMITPYNDDGSVDYKGIVKLVDWYWKKGCHGIFALCQSSEIFNLTLEERVNICKTVVERAKELALNDKTRKPMKIVASGHVSDNFEDQVKELTAISKIQIDALILISNRFDIENTNEDKWIEDLDKLISRLDPKIPLGIYECPRPYKRLLTDKMICHCANTKRFAFIKDTCCDLDLIKHRVELLKDSNVQLYNANAQTFLDSAKAGASGYCGVMANMHPEFYIWALNHIDSNEAQIVQSFICLSAFTESLAYPSTAKYYLNKYENVDIKSYSRTVDYKLVTNYQKSCLEQMKLLGDKIKAQLKIN